MENNEYKPSCRLWKSPDLHSNQRELSSIEKQEEGKQRSHVATSGISGISGIPTDGREIPRKPLTSLKHETARMLPFSLATSVLTGGGGSRSWNQQREVHPPPTGTLQAPSLLWRLDRLLWQPGADSKLIFIEDAFTVTSVWWEYQNQDHRGNACCVWVDFAWRKRRKNERWLQVEAGRAGQGHLEVRELVSKRSSRLPLVTAGYSRVRPRQQPAAEVN